MLIQGLEGAPRRYAVLPETYDTLTQLTVPFVLMMALGQIVFAYNLVQTLRGKRRESGETFLGSLGLTATLIFAGLVLAVSALALDHKNAGETPQAGLGGASAADRSGRGDLHREVRQLSHAERGRDDRRRRSRPRHRQADLSAGPGGDREGRPRLGDDAGGYRQRHRGATGRRLRVQERRQVGLVMESAAAARSRATRRTRTMRRRRPTGSSGSPPGSRSPPR